MKDDDLFVYERLYEGERITVMANFRNKEVPYPENINAEGEVLLSNYADRKNVLRPFEAMMIYGQNN
jgi:trehalose-6-phosphate hydrolase